MVTSMVTSAPAQTKEELLLTLPAAPEQYDASVAPFYSAEDVAFFQELVGKLDDVATETNHLCMITQSRPKENDATRLVLISRADEERLSADITTPAQMKAWFIKHHGEDSSKWVMEAEGKPHLSDRPRYSNNVYAKEEGIFKYVDTAPWTVTQVVHNTVIAGLSYPTAKSILQPVFDEKTTRVSLDQDGNILCTKRLLYRAIAEGIPYTLVQSVQNDMASFYGEHFHANFLFYLAKNQKYTQALHYLSFLLKHHHFRARTTVLGTDDQNRNTLQQIAETLSEAAEKTAFLRAATLQILTRGMNSPKPKQYRGFHKYLFQSEDKNGKILLQYLVDARVLPTFREMKSVDLAGNLIGYLTTGEIPSLSVATDLLGLSPSRSSNEFLAGSPIPEPEVLPVNLNTDQDADLAESGQATTTRVTAGESLVLVKYTGQASSTRPFFSGGSDQADNGSRSQSEPPAQVIIGNDSGVVRQRVGF